MTFELGKLGRGEPRGGRPDNQPQLRKSHDQRRHSVHSKVVSMYKVRIEGLLLRNQAAKSESSLDKVETYKMASSSLLVCLYIDIIPYRYNIYGM